MTTTPAARTASGNAAADLDRQRLLTPGPTTVPPRVRQELALPIIHHRTSAFRAIFKELGEQLQQIFRTRGPVLSIPGSGTTAFEAAQIGLTRPGSKVLSIAGGKFGERWQDVFDAYGRFLDVEQVRLDTPWGAPADVSAVEQALKDHPDISLVTVVHSETSTATASDVQAIAALLRRHDALLLVDGITSVGAFACEMDDWGIDCLVTGSQKAMMLPPGLGYVGLGERALDRLEDIDGSGGRPQYNLDLRKWLSSWRSNDVPFTPPVPLIRGQRVACGMILDQGLEEVQAKTGRLARGTRAAFEAMGLKLVSRSPSPSVSGAWYPDGVDDSAFRAALRERHGIHIAGGQKGRGADWKGRIFRISHMGYVDAEDTRAALQAIETELREAGRNIETGTAVEAFNKAHA